MQDNFYNKILIITGPTAVGKTDFAINLAAKIPSEIVNIDVGQFYEPLNIGTAKPDWKNETISHHLFDIINQPIDINVNQYRKLLIETLQSIWKKNKLPILVGGSGFYIQSLFFPPKESNVNNSSNLIIQEDLWAKLNEIDPERAKKINKKDIYRLQRALQIWHATGVKPSMQEPEYDPICQDYRLIIIARDRNELYERINKRTIQMLNMGWIQETKKLSSEWKSFLSKKKLIGYHDILLYLESVNKDESLLIDVITQKTRNYAKRQITFFKALIKKIEKIDQRKIRLINLSQQQDFEHNHLFK